MADYYLVNGSRNGARTLLVPDKNLLKRNFRDISEIDQITLLESRDKMFNKLSGYNNVDRNGSLYIASYPHRKGINTYPVIFDDERFRYYTGNLGDFADQRSRKVTEKQEGKRTTIELDEDRQFKSYVRSILNDILSHPESDITSYDSLVSAKLKDLIKERYDYYHDMPTERFINSRSYLIRRLLSGYKELRNLTYEYMLYLGGDNMRVRPEYNRKKYWPVTNMMPLDPVKIDDPVQAIPGEQMNLADFCQGIPKTHIKR